MSSGSQLLVVLKQMKNPPLRKQTGRKKQPIGGADFVTWAGVVGLFAIAAGVKLAMAWRDGMRRAELVGRLNGDETAD